MAPSKIIDLAYAIQDHILVKKQRNNLFCTKLTPAIRARIYNFILFKKHQIIHVGGDWSTRLHLSLNSYRVTECHSNDALDDWEYDTWPDRIPLWTLSQGPGPHGDCTIIGQCECFPCGKDIRFMHDLRLTCKLM